MKKNSFLDDDDFDVQLEVDIERPSKKFARLRGWFVAKVRFLDRRGAPDDLFIRDGRTMWIEFKRPGKTPSKQQLEVHNDMRAAGAEVHFVDSLEQALELLS
jgi:hypothetical protein